jgi:hypothetical protein
MVSPEVVELEFEIVKEVAVTPATSLCPKHVV